MYLKLVTCDPVIFLQYFGSSCMNLIMIEPYLACVTWVVGFAEKYKAPGPVAHRKFALTLLCLEGKCNTWGTKRPLPILIWPLKSSLKEIWYNYRCTYDLLKGVKFVEVVT